MAPIKEETQEHDPATPKLFCQMDNHLGCVNCVRWSLDGTRLASGGDDKIIMIWRRSKGSGASFGGGFTKNHENWRCVHTLRGHEGDVLDLSWSPGDRWLASSSVDNSVFIWDISSGATPTVMSILRGHTGLVKGVAWDPVGKYVASQSDDRSVKIWKTSDWACDSTITEPFVECGGTTHVLRLSWSPDGQYLVSAHAMNGGGPTAQIIDREGWKCDKDFVGHRKAVTCVRFHNSIMMRTAPKTSKTQQYCCLAVGSRDKSLSVWMTALQRPLVVIYDVFQDSVLDMSWSTDGYILMACSGDGTVVFIKFNAEDLGTPLSEVEKNSLYQRMYGKGVHDMNVSADKDVIIENAELLNESAVVQRPVPTFLAPEPRVTPENLSQIASRMDDRCETSSSITSSSISTNTTMVTSSPAKQAITKQIETRTKDGKRRITPMFIPLSQDMDVDQQPAAAAVRPVGASTIVSALQTVSVIPPAVLLDSVTAGSAEQQSRMDARLAKMAPAKTSSTLVFDDLQSSNCLAISGAVVGSANHNNNNRMTTTLLTSTGSRPEVFNAGMARVVGTRRLIVQNHFQKATPATPTAIHRVVCHRNDQQQMGGASKRHEAATAPLWQYVTGSAICNFNCSIRYIVVGCVDGTVCFLDINCGRLILPVITMANAVVQSAFALAEEGSAAEDFKDLAGIVTETGIVRIWDLVAQKTDLAVTCRDLLPVTGGVNGGGGGGGGAQQATQPSSAILMFAIANGTPFIVLANGTSYCYARNLESWLVLSGKDLLQQRSMIRCTSMPNATFAKDMKSYPLASIQTTVLGMMPVSVVRAAQSGAVGGGAPLTEWESLAQLTFVENQIKLCEAIRSPAELKYWYSNLGYTMALGTATTELRLRQVLDDLLGPVFATSAEVHRKRVILVSEEIFIAEGYVRLMSCIFLPGSTEAGLAGTGAGPPG